MSKTTFSFFGVWLFNEANVTNVVINHNFIVSNLPMQLGNNCVLINQKKILLFLFQKSKHVFVIVEIAGQQFRAEAIPSSIPS
jgi:hypothetical protein